MDTAQSPRAMALRSLPAANAGQRAWSLALGALPLGPGWAMDSAALERVLATKGLGAEFRVCGAKFF